MEITRIPFPHRLLALSLIAAASFFLTSCGGIEQGGDSAMGISGFTGNDRMLLIADFESRAEQRDAALRNARRFSAGLSDEEIDAIRVDIIAVDTILDDRNRGSHCLMLYNIRTGRFFGTSVYDMKSVSQVGAISRIAEIQCLYVASGNWRPAL